MNERSSLDTHSKLIIAEIPYLRRYARALTRNASAADDLVQDALLRAVSNVGQFQQGTNLRAWLLTIVHHCFIDDTRRAKRARDGIREAKQRVGGSYTRPSQFANLELIDVQAALQSLPDEQRVTLILVALEDMSYEEAAQVTDVPVGTIRSRLSRARHALLAKIEGEEKGQATRRRGEVLRRRVKPRDDTGNLVVKGLLY